MAKEPQARRPYMPGYGILPADGGTGLLPWSWAEERLRASHDYWLATVWPDGRPHVMPVWGVWAEDRTNWFSSSRRARKARNLSGDPRAVATTDNALEPVVVEGRAVVVDDTGAVGEFARWVDAKYSTNYGAEFFTDPNIAVYRLTPAWVFALTEDDFSGSPTRWEFTSSDR